MLPTSARLRRRPRLSRPTRPSPRRLAVSLALAQVLLAAPAHALLGTVPIKGPKGVCAGTTVQQINSNGGWAVYSGAGTDYDFLVPPVAPPHGSGAMSQTVSPGTFSSIELYHPAYGSLPLGALLAVFSSIEYSNLDVATLTGDLPAYVIFVDRNADGFPDDQLRYFPSNNSCTGFNAWATCSVLSGQFVNTVAAADPDGNLATPFTFAAYLAANPDARTLPWPAYPVAGIVLGLGPVGGSASTYVDRLRFQAFDPVDGPYDEIVFDFEEDCANYGGDADADCWCDSTDDSVRVRDNCPGVANPDQGDGDADGVGNLCDNCAGAANANQGDGDGDGRGDACDNCPGDANAGQENADGDSAGDACDACPNDAANDADGDGLCADADNCPIDANPAQTDGDGDGFGDACDRGDIYTIAGEGDDVPCVACGDGGPALGASLQWPGGLAYDAAGNLYVADRDNHAIRRIDPSGTITRVAGDGSFTYSGENVDARLAGVPSPWKVAVDPSSTYLYFSDESHRVRRVHLATNVIETVAGNGVEGYAGDGGPAAAARLREPRGLAVSATTLYIADHGNLVIRAVDLTQPSRPISTLAGNGVDEVGTDDVPPLASALPYPTDLVLVGEKLYVTSDSENDNRVRVIDFAQDKILGFAGNGECDEPIGDGGPAVQARLCFASGIAADAAGNVYIADTYNQRIRKVSGGTITTIAGSAQDGFAGDGAPATSARLDEPYDVAVAPDGSVVVADSGNFRIRRIAQCGNDRVESGEQCDDGPNPTSNDGCSEVCRLEPQPPVSDTADPGETVATPNAVAPTASTPIGSAVTTPVAGPVSIQVTATPVILPAGYTALGSGIQIGAPVASEEAPLELVFSFDVTLAPLTMPVDSIDIFRNGVLVTPCTGPAGTAVPATCVKSRTRTPSDDVEIRVLAVQASEWSAGVAKCGDGEVQGSEACDDGDLGSGDGCDAACAVESCFACSGTSPSSCSPLPDGDGDGLCDVADICSNSGEQTFKIKPKPQIALSKIDSDPVPGNDKLVVQGIFDLATGQAFANLDPLVTGARVVLLNATGGTELDVTLPGGVYAGSGTRGWKGNAAGTKWQYLDRTKDGSLSSVYGGIAQLQVVDRSKRVPREVMAKVQGKSGTYPVVAADAPLRAIVVLGGDAAGLAGLCGESDFAASECSPNRARNALKCKK